MKKKILIVALFVLCVFSLVGCGKTKINLNQLKKELGDDLYNVNITTSRKVYAEDLIFLINQYISHKITLQEIVDWVNVVWFTDLYEYKLRIITTLKVVKSVIFQSDRLHFVKNIKKTTVY